MLLDLSFDQLKQALVDAGFENYRAAQLFDWIYKKACLDPAKMTNLNPSLRTWLQGSGLSLLELVQRQDSSDGQTFKFLWKLRDDQLVESVLIEAPDRLTLCVSSQVGCAARCAFCASGKEGLLRNLSAGEILEQFIRVQAFLLSTGRHLTNVVFMGMGEPLHNLDAVVQTINTLSSDKAAHFSPRRMTVSTVGIVEGIHTLRELDLGIQLVLSLHGPTHDIRKRIIPIARRYPLAEVMAACDRYSATTKRDLTYEYTLIEGINDAIEHAHQLADLLENRQCTVNLIPYNPIVGIRLKRPSREAIEAFREVLESRSINHTCRYTKGVDIAAACGQLALKKNSGIPQIVDGCEALEEDFSEKVFDTKLTVLG